MKTKICSKCKIRKLLSNFYKDKNTKAGYKSQCKNCCKEYRTRNKEKIRNQKRDYLKRNKEKIFKKIKTYRKTYYWKYLLSQIKQRCENVNYSKFKEYGAKGIKCLITAEEIRQLMIRDNYWNLKKPSIDRINNDGNYEYSNCRFIEIEENCGKDKRISILQFDLNGNFIREWDSLIDASKELNILVSGISHCLNGKCKKYKGFIWKYKNEKI